MNLSGHVLIIDDELSLRQTLARILQRVGLEVTTVGDGEQGLAYLRTTHFDLVYMDIRMPGLAGLDVLKIIQADYPGLPVILFTAQPDVNSAVEALRLGATDYLLKPLKPEVIIEKTEAILLIQQKERRKKEILSQIETLQSELKTLDGETPVPESTPRNVPVNERFLKRGHLVLDLLTRRLTIGDRVVNLPPTSFDYLLVLARHAPDLVDYQTLVAEAQGYQADSREAQELSKWHIHHVRQAIETDARNPTYLFNVRGTGYRLITE